MRGPAIRLTLLAAACAAVWAFYFHLGFAGFFSDPIWHLEPARAFARGEGLSTRLLLTAQLADFPPGVRLPVAPLFHGPLSLLALGGAYRLLGTADWVPLACSFFFCLVSGLLSYRLGRDAGGERAGLLGAAFYWLSVATLERNSTALTDPLFTAFVTAAFLCLLRSAEPRVLPLRWAAASGVLLGLASGTRLAGQSYWLGFFAVALWLHRGNWRPAAALLAGLLPPLAALAAYNYTTAGKLFYSPGFYLLYWSKTFPGGRAVSSFMGLSAAEALLKYPGDVLQKALTGPFYAASRFLESARGPYVMALCVLGLLFDWRTKPALARLRGAAAGILLPVLAVNIIVSYGAVDYLQPMFPILMPLAAAAFWRLADEHGPAFGRLRPAAAALCAFLFLSPLALAAKEAWKTRPARTELYRAHRALGAFVAGRTSPGEVLYSDDPATIVWHADRAAVLLTATVADAEAAFAHLSPDAVVVTSLRSEGGDFDSAWARALRDGTPVLGFAPCERFSEDGVSAVLLRRKGACRRR